MKAWAATVLYVPLLYALGWLLAQPLRLWNAPSLGPEILSLVGRLFSFLLFLASLPWWVRHFWNADAPWQELGLAGPLLAQLKDCCRGLLGATALLAPLVLVSLIGGWARWQPRLTAPLGLNALALMAGVGFAEELLFRGWLWGELGERLGDPHRRQAGPCLAQAAVFSLAHTRFNLPLLPMLSQLGGLLLLGIALALQRRRDGGRLGGAIGFHGGLVGGWFLLVSGWIDILPDAPALLIGPGGAGANPIGELLGWVGLSVWLLHLRQPFRQR